VHGVNNSIGHTHTSYVQLTKWNCGFSAVQAHVCVFHSLFACLICLWKALGWRVHGENSSKGHTLYATDQLELRLLRSPSTCVSVPFLDCMLDLPLVGFGLKSTWCKQFNRTHPHFLCATDQVKLRLLRSPSTCVCVPFLVCMLDLPLEGFGLKSTWCKQFNRTHPHFLSLTQETFLEVHF